mmetsp:Transcript_23683/g.58875  ORF Transcript_23683/g.58875 Transcript_23683/m.58875 type:complete len:178 (+) Transcript_23683:370-903(+)
MGVEGALEFLEESFCEIKSIAPLTDNKQCRLLLIEGTRLMNKREEYNRNFRHALKPFGELLKILDESGDTEYGSLLRALALHRKAECHSILGEYDIALRDCDSALSSSPASQSDTIRCILFTRAHCKAAQGDLSGAFDDCMRPHVGPFLSFFSRCLFFFLLEYLESFYIFFISRGFR